MKQYFNDLCIKIYLYFWLHDTKNKIKETPYSLKYSEFTALESCRYVINDSYNTFIDSATASNKTLELFLEHPKSDADFDIMFSDYLASSRSRLRTELKRKYTIVSIPDKVLNEFIIDDIVKRIILRMTCRSGTSPESQLRLIEMKISDMLKQKTRFDLGILKMYLIDIKDYPLDKDIIPESSKLQYEQMKGFFKNV